MSNDSWMAVDQYISETLIRPDTVLDAALAAGAAAGMPAINVAPNQGKLLQLFARMLGARRILEIGTLAGYSTIWMARALGPGGRVITLELDPSHATVARENFVRAGVSDLVELHVGRAIETLVRLTDDRAAPFDLVFIDADKSGIPEYFTSALRLSRPGTVIVVDNVVRDGKLADATNTDPNVIGVRRLHEMLATESRVSATTIQTVGSKGYDGLTIAVVTA